MPNNSNNTQMNTETLESTISDLTSIEDDLNDIEGKIEESDAALLSTWKGTARASFLCASTYARNNIHRIMLSVSGIYDILVRACEDRVILDQNVANAAEKKE